ncbi:AsmA family protein [Nitratireductor mangrovi]|uniref:AsmA family protein n=1 Tax=Nitratireductor mangrovi TaxID=2599600 RepID=A0A5B8L0Y7_9HYPH|nr:AsmA-like C-terminal region-containing protein [Nitratireductor mangrovi]QDZ01667.1 AsmA family protein [Nitratireductor mangrovi]
MPSRAARRSIWIFGICVLALIALLAAIPYVASTQIVRNRIAHEIGSWTGYRVELLGNPRIDVWPTFRAVLHDVAFKEWSDPDDPPVLQAERIELELSAIAALRGDVVFSRMHLLRPMVRVRDTGAVVPLPSEPMGGRVKRAVVKAREAVAANPAAPDTSQMPADPLGSVEFTDGQIVLVADGKEEILVTALSGRGGWPSLNRPLSITAKGVWRGENVSVETTTSQPLTLFAGGSAPVTFAMTAAPLTARFEGIATFSGSGFIDGRAQFSSPSLRRALEWSRTEISPGSAVGAASLSGHLIGDMQRLKVEEAEIEFSGHPGMGVIDFSFASDIPAVAGTLAFETLDLRSLLAAFTRTPDNAEAWHQEIDTRFAHDLGLDLRLSADRATAGPIAMTEVAATVQIKDGLAAFDISDATAFGGTVQAGMRIDRRDGKNHAQFRFLATDIDTAPLATAATLTRPAPQARATLSVILNSNVVIWDDFLSRADGSISAKLGPGSIAGIDLAAFLERTRQGGFFPLSEVSKGTLPIQEAELKASIANGVARLDIARAISGDRAISLTGIVPYVGRGLALSGLVAPKDVSAGTPDPQSVAAFFVGGSWSTPFVSPVLAPVPPVE